MIDSDRLTVVQILPALEAGGVERGTLEIADALVRRGHRSIVISAGGRLVAPLLQGGSEHLTLAVGKKSLTTPGLLLPLSRILRDLKPDIVHARSRLPAWMARLALSRLPPALQPAWVTSVHGPYSVNRYSRVMVSGDRVIAISEFILRYIQDNYPQASPDRITVIPRGIDPAAFPYGHRPEHDWHDRWHADYPHLQGKRLITLPARLTRWKGQLDFIEVVSRLRQEDHEIHGLIAGEPPPRKQAYFQLLREQVEARGLTDAITFVGHRPDLREVMSISDIVLSLSTEPEAFGRTPLEALSLGIPVIGYDHGGVGEVMAGVYPAGLVRLSDIAGVVDRIREFMISAPPVPVSHPYTLARMQDSTLALYESLARSRRCALQAMSS